MAAVPTRGSVRMRQAGLALRTAVTWALIAGPCYFLLLYSFLSFCSVFSFSLSSFFILMNAIRVTGRGTFGWLFVICRTGLG